MSRRLLIQVPPLTPESSVLAHQIMNLIASVHFQLVQPRLGAVDDIDKYHTPFVITVHHTRQLGRVRMIVEQELHRHNLEQDVQVALVEP